MYTTVLPALYFTIIQGWWCIFRPTQVRYTPLLTYAKSAILHIQPTSMQEDTVAPEAAYEGGRPPGNLEGTFPSLETLGDAPLEIF